MRDGSSVVSVLVAFGIAGMLNLLWTFSLDGLLL